MSNFIPLLVPAVKTGDLDQLLEYPGTSAKTVSKQNQPIANLVGKTPGDPLTVGDWYVFVNKKFNL